MVTIPVCAQPLHVYSELARTDAGGEVTAPQNPRKILSPAIARNAFTSFQVVVQVPKSTHYVLYVGQNPEAAVQVTLYREAGDRLDLVELPYEDDATRVFWMDVWADRTAPVRRIKVEPQLWIDGDWVTYPMEVRVVDATVPDGKRRGGLVPPADVMRSHLCGIPEEALPSDSLSVVSSRFRNAQQDVALAARASKEDLQRLFGPCNSAPPSNPEWYLRIRDYLYRLR